jgi:two-component system invasion response regulator UvrY
MIRVLIADDHAIVRKGLKQLLLEEYSTAIIDEAGDAEELVKKAFDKEWDVVICDLSMPGRSGLDALKQIKLAFPELPVLIMSMYPPEQYAYRVLKAGAYGYLSKDSIHDELINAVQTVLRGRKFITSSIAEKLVEVFDTDSNQYSHGLLSDREFDVFKLLAAGKTVTEIADRLSLSANTVSTYRSRILEKMNMKTNAEITRYALEKKLIQ